MRRLLVPVVAVAVAGAAWTAWTAAPRAAAQAPSATKVSMKDFEFIPAKVTIKAGETVTWTYDETPDDPAGCENPLLQLPGSPVTCPGHSATADDKGPDGKPLFDSGLHRADGFPYSFTFTTPGTYHYICTVHGGEAANNPLTSMEGDVVVEAASASAPAAAAPPSQANAPQPTSAPSQVAGNQASTTTGQLSDTGGLPSMWWALLPLGVVVVLRARRR